MKKRSVVSLILALTMLLVCFTGCGGKDAGQPDAQPQAGDVSQPVTVKFSLSHAANEPACEAAYNFAERVKAASDGKIIVEVYPDNQLGSERDVVEGLQLHTVEMVDPANAVFTNFVNEAYCLEMPMVFDTVDQLEKAANTIGVDYVSEFAEAQGFKLFGYFYMGTRNIMTTTKEVNSMADLKGLKIRTQESQANMAAFKAFGASPTPMAYNELFTALESKVIDGAEAANTNYFMKDFYEVAPNWAVVGWIMLANPVVMDLEFWNSLPAEYQAILETEIAAMIAEETDLYEASEGDYLTQLEAAGVNVTYPDTAEFKAAAQTVYPDFYQYFDQSVLEQMMAVK